MNSRLLIPGAGLLALALSAAQPAAAHCDTMDGPVVKDAKVALSKGDVRPVLRWVRPADEPGIRTAFAKTLTVRRKGPEARDLADRYFYDVLVRVHRAGEGEPFTGVKPSGTPLEPGIAEADRSIATGNVDRLAKDTAERAAAGVRARHARVMSAKRTAGTSVAGGRRYVAAYVEYLHYVEGLHAAASGPGHAEGKHLASR